MTQNVIVRKTSRVVAMSAVLGTTAALLLVGAPADAATVELARGVAITMARGV